MPDKLLQVLDMTREEQWKWLENKFPDDLHCCCGTPICLTGRQELADLAFRLKDEAKDDFVFGLIEVFQYITERSKLEIPSPAEMIKESQPIHWIVASLIAKGLAKEKRRPL